MNSFDFIFSSIFTIYYSFIQELFSFILIRLVGPLNNNNNNIIK